MLRFILVFLLLLAPAPRLTLEASTARSDFLPGQRFTVSAHLFNDGDAATQASLAIQAPVGFVLLTPAPLPHPIAMIAPGRALGANWTYQVAPDAPKGLARFTVVAYGNAGMPALVRDVMVRVGPIVAAPARGWRRVWLAVIR